eukprot:7080647-Pyramimonas_sp.AAC.1
MAQPRSRVPGPGQLLARTTHNLDAMEYSDDRRVVVGLYQDELTEMLPLKDYVSITRVWITEPDPLHGARWLQQLPNSTNPGIHPSRWFNMGHDERRKAVEQFRLEKRDFFGIEDPGPCVALLRNMGIDPVECREDIEGPEVPELPDGNLHPGADVRRQRNGETAVSEEGEVDWHALLHPAGPAEDLPTDAGSG